MTLLQSLLAAVQNLPEAFRIRTQILSRSTMTFAQEVIAAMFKITNDERYGFYVAYEPVLIERIIELTELPFNGESVAKVKTKLLGLTTPLKGIGIEITRNGEYVTVWGPGVKK